MQLYMYYMYIRACTCTCTYVYEYRKYSSGVRSGMTTAAENAENLLVSFLADNHWNTYM